MLLIDNQDSFTYNIVHAFQKLGIELEICSNTSSKIFKSKHPIVIGPGPGKPSDAGAIVKLIQSNPAHPILGICLGHQAMAEAFGAKIVKAKRPIHGKRSSIHHNSHGLFSQIPSPFLGMRYHSLVVEEASLPSCLEVLAWTEGEIMALKHRELPYYSVQYHPDSFMSDYQEQFFQNVVTIFENARLDRMCAPLDC
jgi:anthranilate synthase component II